jgi:hypothetical protein
MCQLFKRKKVKMAKTSYDLWMDDIDKIILPIIGLTTHDLCDFPSRDMFLDGCTPLEGAISVLEFSDAPQDIIDMLS